ncbi:MAG TPA: FtsQ-type POTRA domain-containing protein [Solirubrobacteraceae bacterium]|jgi:cell division protein FtsQ
MGQIRRLPARAAGLARRHPRVLGATVLLVVVGGGGWMWLRDSSLARVNKVTINGATGPQAVAVRGALTDAARGMSTLHVDSGRLRAAVHAYPEVAAIGVHAHPLHSLTIDVVERQAVAALAVGAHRIAIAADGTLLRDQPSDRLPTVNAPVLPVAKLTGRPAAALAAIAAAPAAMRPHVDRIFVGPDGIEADLRNNGPRLILGAGDRARAKWVAAARVLGDAGSQGATYVDVRLPERPAAGGFSGGQPSTTG